MLDDRVYLFVKRGETGRAIGELEAWTEKHPRDENAILWLARMLRENGRTDEAVALYRRLISMDERRDR
jgi:DNA-binding SARP family transcriptional activator